MQPNNAEFSIGERQFDDCVLRDTSQLHPRSRLADGLRGIHAAAAAASKGVFAVPSVAALALALLIPTAAFAGGADDLGMTPIVNGLVGLFSGPIAKLAAVILIILGVILFSRGHDMGEGIKTVGTVALGIGLLIGIVAILGQINGTGAIIPDLPARIAIGHHAIAFAVQPK